MPAIASVRMLGFELAGVLIFASGDKKTTGAEESNRAYRRAQYLTALKGEMDFGLRCPCPRLVCASNEVSNSVPNFLLQEPYERHAVCFASKEWDEYTLPSHPSLNR